MRIFFLFLSIHALSISWGTSQRIENDTKMYFKSEAYKSCNKIWKKYRIAYENTIASALGASYGHQTLNVYIQRPKDALLLSTGYYHSDNQIEILFQNVLLEEFPMLNNPVVSLDLCGNSLSIESTLSKMIIHADYSLFRNRSDIIYSLKDQNPFQSSPFRFQQVQNTGQLAVTAEACMLTGTVLTKFTGNTVTAGIDMLRLRNCQFNVDIYNPGQKTPPVLANYLFKEDGPYDKNILVQALSKELMPQLQAVLFAHINTSAIFDQDLVYVESSKQVLMSEIESYIDSILRNHNMYNTNNNMGTVDLSNFNINWNDAFDGTEKDSEIAISSVTMSGLDSAYSAHIGGPYRIEELPVRIAERVRMSNVQVLGVISLRGAYEGKYNFAADIYDVNIDIILDVNKLEEKYKGAKNGDGRHQFIVGEWRNLEFSCPELEELPIEAIVTGYLLNELPKHLATSLSSVIDNIVSNNLENEESKVKSGNSVDGNNGLSDETLLEDNQNAKAVIDKSNEKLQAIKEVKKKEERKKKIRNNKKLTIHQQQQ